MRGCEPTLSRRVIRIMEWYMNSKARIELLPGDIFLSRGNAPHKKIIRLGERTIGEKPSRVNHTGMIVMQSIAMWAHCVEALVTVQEHPIWDAYHGTRDDVAVYRCKDLTDEQRKDLARYARSYKGRKYGWLKIGTHFLDWCVGGAYFFRRLTNSDKYPICSWVVAQSYSKLGLNFGCDPGAANPDDIDDYVLSHPEKYEEIIPLGRLE